MWINHCYESSNIEGFMLKKSPVLHAEMPRERDASGISIMMLCLL